MCDAETQRIEAQRAVDEAQQKALNNYVQAADKLGKLILQKGLIGQGLAFLQGVGTAIADDIAAPLQSLFGSSSWADRNGIDSFSQPSPVYDPLFGNQDAMAAGRIIGHLVTTASGLIGGVFTGGLAGAVAAGGLAFAPETGGSSAVAATAGAATILVVGGTASLGLVKEGIAGLSNDPNIQFSQGSQGEADSYKKYDPKEIEKKYELNKGEFHREVKPDILADLTSKDSPYKDLMKKMGNNPDIYLSSDGQIEIVSTQFKGKSFVTDLNITDFLP